VRPLKLSIKLWSLVIWHSILKKKLLFSWFFCFESLTNIDSFKAFVSLLAMVYKINVWAVWWVISIEDFIFVLEKSPWREAFWNWLERIHFLFKLFWNSFSKKLFSTKFTTKTMFFTLTKRSRLGPKLKENVKRTSCWQINIRNSRIHRSLW